MAIDTTDAKNSLFGGLKITPVNEVVAIIQPEKQACTPKVKQPINKIPEPDLNDSSSEKAKWLTLDKVTVLLTTEQKAGLDRVSKKIMKHRSNDLKGQDNKERITTNTIIRALISQFLEVEELAQMKTLSSESEVQEWIKDVFKIE